MKYIYLLAGDDTDLELAEAEANAISGAVPISRKVVASPELIDTSRTAYVTGGLELLASGKTVDDAVQAATDLGIEAEGFGMKAERIPGKLDISKRAAADAFAIAITGRPNLDNPREKFLAYITADGVWFGRQLPEPEQDWRRFIRKPADSSSSLPARPSRGICNLLVKGGEHVIDPCCGTGTLLLHAASLGARVTGFDINEKMVDSSNKNLEHYGFGRAAELGDATKLSGEYDIMMTDLPYGNMSDITGEGERLIENILGLAKRGIIVVTVEMADVLRGYGVEVVRDIHLRKFSVTRRIFVYERK